VMDEMIITQLCGNRELRKKFNQNLIDSFVNGNSRVRWCPAPGCTCAIALREIHAERNESVVCTCGNYFCFRCGDEGHEPALCKQVEKWKVQNSGGDEKLNEKFISSISRKCPNCNSAIEKNGGCNHMHCQKCHYHFCWLCMGKFGKGPLGDTSGYGNHKCNDYKQEDSALADQDDWERFRWYSERYNTHMRSLQMEKKLNDSKASVMEQLQKVHNLSIATSQFYDTALHQLFISRSCVRNSYIFGYFRPTEFKEIHKELFEHRQNELERHVEILSSLVEAKVLEIFKNKIQVITTAKMVENSAKALLDVARNATVENK